MSVASVGTVIQARKRGFAWDTSTVAQRALRSVIRDPEVTVPALVIPVFMYIMTVGALQDFAERIPGLAQIHRRDDYAAAERAIGAREGDGPGTIWGRGGPVSVFSCRGETL